jgi:hypothetical protein
MTDLRINYHPNHSYALYIQPAREHDIYQDVHKIIPATEHFCTVGSIGASSSTIYIGEEVLSLAKQPLPNTNRWSAKDTAFGVKTIIEWENKKETRLLWIGDNLPFQNDLNSTEHILLDIYEDELAIYNGTLRDIKSMSFLIGVTYPVTVTPCILQQIVDIYNVQDEFGPDAGALFTGNSEKLPYKIALTTTYLDKVGIDPLHDDWLIINGIRYVIARIRPINRNYKTGQRLPSVFTALVYLENSPEHLLDEIQPMDFVQVISIEAKDKALTVLVASGISLTHYRYYDGYEETEPALLPEWIRLREGYFFTFNPSELDIERGQYLIEFMGTAGKETKLIKKVLRYHFQEVIESTTTTTTTTTEEPTTTTTTEEPTTTTTPPLSWAPVTNVEVDDLTYIPDVTKIIGTTILPDVGERNFYWTLGQKDGNLIISNILGTLPPYGLGVDGKQHTDSESRLLVRSTWGIGYLVLCLVIENGREEGSRNLTPEAISERLVLPNGTDQIFNLAAIFCDTSKDFIKLFMFTKRV